MKSENMSLNFRLAVISSGHEQRPTKSPHVISVQPAAAQPQLSDPAQ